MRILALKIDTEVTGIISEMSITAMNNSVRHLAVLFRRVITGVAINITGKEIMRPVVRMTLLGIDSIAEEVSR